MIGELFRNNENNKYYLIDNVGAYNYIVIEFETFRNMFMPIELVERTMYSIEFNAENVKNLLDDYAAFEGFVIYDYFNSHNYIIYHNKIYYIRNWVDLFNFANKII